MHLMINFNRCLRMVGLGNMIFNHDIINNAISKLKKTEYNLDDLYQKLKSLMKDMIERDNPERYRQLDVLLKEINRAMEESKNHTYKLERIADLYESYGREAVNLVDNLPLLTDNNVLSEWISNIVIYGIEDIKNESNPMLSNNILQHEDWLINRMLDSLNANDNEVNLG